MIDIGTLNRRVTVQARATGIDAEGGVPDVWSGASFTAWAGFGAPGWRSARLAGALQAEITHEITIRYRTGVAAGMRLVYRSRNFAIRAITDDEEAHEALILHCAEGLSDG